MPLDRSRLLMVARVNRRGSPLFSNIPLRPYDSAVSDLRPTETSGKSCRQKLPQREFTLISRAAGSERLDHRHSARLGESHSSWPTLVSGAFGPLPNEEKSRRPAGRT